jgi:hypothetical protein
MRTHRKARFLKWAESQHFALDRRHPGTNILSFDPNPELSRFWVVPSPTAIPSFLSTILDLMEPWNSCLVWRHLGSWPGREADYPPDQVEAQILAGLGVPTGSSDILEFEKAEYGTLLSLLFCATVLGWSTEHDLYLIPDHAGYVVQTDHHRVVHVSFRNQVELEQFIGGMSASNYHLPEASPDSTFKAPDWMKRG